MLPLAACCSLVVSFFLYCVLFSHVGVYVF